MPTEPYGYRLVRKQRTWDEANTYCSYFDMTLVVISNEDEQRQLMEYLLLEETRGPPRWALKLNAAYSIQLGPSTIARNTALVRGRRAKQPEVGTDMQFFATNKFIFRNYIL